MYARTHVHMHAVCTCRALGKLHVRAQGLQKHLAANLVDDSYMVI